MARRPGLRLTALVLITLLVACGSALGPGLESASDPTSATGPASQQALPPGLVDALTDADGGYGWHRCRLSGDWMSAQVAAVDSDGENGFVVDLVGDEVRSVLAWQDGEMVERYDPGGPWEQVADHRRFDLTREPLRSVDGILSLFDLDGTQQDPVDPSVTHPLVERVEAVNPSAQGSTLRLEGLPAGWPRYHIDEEREADAALNGLGEWASTVWLVDVWADGNGAVERTRYQTIGSGGTTVSELRFLPLIEVFDANGHLADPGCLTSATASGSAPWMGYESWDAGRQVPLQVSIDPDGRPYDALGADAEIVRLSAGTLHSPDGELLVMDGNSVEVNPASFADEATPIAVDTSVGGPAGLQAINVDIIWETGPDDASPQDGSVLGVWLGPTDAEVERWDDFEFAYGTDGGVGGVVSPTVLAVAEQLDVDDVLIPDPDYSASIQFFDLDGLPGDDTLIFSNGYGDGGFPLTRGRDSGGHVVANVIWRTQWGLPWRLAIPEGIPPGDVTRREEELLECIDGRRQIDPDGFCPPDADE